VRCPECVAQGQLSKVYIGGTIVTDMGTDRYYDEDGVFHNHDPNIRSTSYECSNKHYWYDGVMPKCPVEGCTYA
jgi:hypothetical protein